jgi:hypothetical protein
MIETTTNTIAIQREYDWVRARTELSCSRSSWNSRHSQ